MFTRLLGALERPEARGRTLRADFGWEYLASAVIGFAFAASAPVAIILAVGSRGGLSADDIASWIFGAFFLNSLFTLWLSWRYRQPLVFLWSIAGSVVAGPALQQYAFSEVIGAYLATGILLMVLGLSGWMARLMRALPMPIIMAMVAGVFLDFGLDLVYSLRDDAFIAAPMIGAFLLLTALPSLSRRLPPLIAALAVGIVMVAVSGQFEPTGGTEWLARPNLYWPSFSAAAMLELVIPLAVTALAAHNAQGIAVIKRGGLEPPVNMITWACGLGSLITGFTGSVSTNLTGPTTGILAAMGERRRWYIAALFVGLFSALFGLFAPLFTRWMLAAPAAFIATLAGLALFGVLRQSFITAFSGRFTYGALVSLLVTLADVPILGIGAPFWALVFGYLAARLLEPADFRNQAA